VLLVVCGVVLLGSELDAVTSFTIAGAILTYSCNADLTIENECQEQEQTQLR
jgi:hypothetical protein